MQVSVLSRSAMCTPTTMLTKAILKNLELQLLGVLAASLRLMQDQNTVCELCSTVRNSSCICSAGFLLEVKGQWWKPGLLKTSRNITRNLRTTSSRIWSTVQTLSKLSSKPKKSDRTTYKITSLLHCIHNRLMAFLN